MHIIRNLKDKFTAARNLLNTEFKKMFHFQEKFSLSQRKLCCDYFWVALFSNDTWTVSGTDTKSVLFDLA